MKSEEALSQENFSCEQEKAFVNIVYTANALCLQEVKRLKPHGISPEQYNVLRILRGSHPRKMNLLPVVRLEM